jgi:hypothetical protein
VGDVVWVIIVGVGVGVVVVVEGAFERIARPALGVAEGMG